MPFDPKNINTADMATVTCQARLEIIIVLLSKGGVYDDAAKYIWKLYPYTANQIYNAGVPQHIAEEIAEIGVLLNS